jgi:hypothetical protein
VVSLRQRQLRTASAPSCERIHLVLETPGHAAAATVRDRTRQRIAGSWGPLAGKFKPMTGGIPFWWLKRAHYRDFPRDIRCSRVADALTHVGGTTIEIVIPLVLLFSTNAWLTLSAAR